MIAGSFGRYVARTARDHDASGRLRVRGVRHDLHPGAVQQFPGPPHSGRAQHGVVLARQQQDRERVNHSSPT
jgi:hypothetical protein